MNSFSFLKRFIKKAAKTTFAVIAFILFYSGILILYLKKRYQNKFLVVFYHEVGENRDTLGGLVTRPHNFEKQIRFLSKWFKPVHGNSVNSILSGQLTMKHPVLITFDGGYKGNILHALPILKNHDVPAVVYIVTDSIEHKEVPWTTKLSIIIRSTTYKHLNFKLNERPIFNGSLKNKKQVIRILKQNLYPLNKVEREQVIRDLAKKINVDLDAQNDHFMSWKDIHKLDKSSLISIGSHTISHPRLIDISRSEAREEIVLSKKLIEEKLETPIHSFCYPDGKIDKEIIHIVEEAGYKNATTTVNGVNALGANPFTLKRIGGGDMPLYLFALKLSGLFRRLYI